jgi:hypothetical protein
MRVSLTLHRHEVARRASAGRRQWRLHLIRARNNHQRRNTRGAGLDPVTLS